MRTNKSGVTEVAHVRSYGSKSYEDNWEHIFGKKESVKNTESVEEVEKTLTKKEIKELARASYIDLESGQDTEGFPESASYIYGFMKGFEEALKGMGKD